MSGSNFYKWLFGTEKHTPAFNGHTMCLSKTHHVFFLQPSCVLTYHKTEHPDPFKQLCGEKELCQLTSTEKKWRYVKWPPLTLYSSGSC